MRPTSRGAFRLVTPNAKFVYLFLASFVVAAVYGVAMLGPGEPAAQLVGVAMSLVVVGIAVRCFRDPDVEPYAAPREWWRMTARPASGYLCGALFLAQALRTAVLAFQEPHAWVSVVGVATGVGVAALFFRSSARLRAARRRPVAGPGPA